MKFPRRRFLHLAAGAAALPVLSRSASAQAYWLGVGAPKDTPSDEPAWCRHQHRNRGRRECPLGWLHAPDGWALKCGQRDALRQTQIHISSRHRSRRKRNPSASSPAGGPVGRGQKRPRVDRLRQSQSRQDHDGIVRSRFDIIERLNKEIAAALADPNIKARFAALGGTVFRRNGEVGQGGSGGQHQAGIDIRPNN